MPAMVPVIVVPTSASTTVVPAQRDTQAHETLSRLLETRQNIQYKNSISEPSGEPPPQPHTSCRRTRTVVGSRGLRGGRTRRPAETA